MISKRRREERSFTLVVAGLAAVGAIGCGEGAQGWNGEDVVTEQSEIIGGTAIDVSTQRALGLVDLGNCSGALMTPDFVLTAAHCVNFGMIGSMNYRIARTDGGIDTRRGQYAIQAGSADIALVRMTPVQPGMMWPNVSHPITTAAESSFVNQFITCYGRGASAFDSDGVGVVGSGTWKSLTKQVVGLAADPIGGDAYQVNAEGWPGTQILAFGDSGANCIAGNGQALGVLSTVSCTWQGQGQPGDPGFCDGNNVTSISAAFLRATADFRSYLTEGLNRPAATFRWLSTINGWTIAPYGANRPGINYGAGTGVITLRGATMSGTGQPFEIPSGFRPNGRVYVPVSAVNTSIGRLVIETSGVVAIEGEGGSPDPSAFTSLDGVSYLVDSSGVTPLTLTNGWTTTPYGTRAPAVKVVNGVVRFQGAMGGGATSDAFYLPFGFRPAVKTAYVPVGLCNATKGRLTIRPDGRVTVHAENGAFGNAQCFTSLEGASFVIDTNGSSSVALENGWGAGGFNTGFVSFKNDNGVIRFQGAAAGGSTTRILTLPPAFRPATNVWIPVDLYGAKRGRILVQPNGQVDVESSQLFDAQGFISFEGASFGI